ncbi:hypothetical protein B0A55_03321 [Friedmanniomyces simplex]|uniref:DUF6604 domain-containing protein n=1 Tax=Friedmanniomyces simplex TaxID=329884 RepID=A0A4U0XWA2_9PEZI|nr:hypothetical protein B0A55_03321 [Friedmanniomyces simplex]
MASYAISDLHERYKKGTNRAVQWLAEAAGGAGVVPTSAQHPSTAIKLSTSDLIRLAERIAQRANPKRATPKNIEVTISILKEAIALRRESAAFYRQSHELLKRSQKEMTRLHSHFIDVLETVLGHLNKTREGSLASCARKKGKKQKGRTSKARVAKVDARPNVLANIFEGLSVEVTTTKATQRDPYVKSSSSPLATSAAAAAVPQYELEAQDGEQNFAVWCFFKECREIRPFLLNTWNAYVNKGAESASSLESFRCEGMDADAHNPAEMLCIPAYIALMLVRATSSGGQPLDRLRETIHYADATHPFVYSVLEVADISGLLTQQLEEWHQSGVGMDTFYSDVLPCTNSRSPLHLYAVIQMQLYMDIADIVGHSQGIELNLLLGVSSSIKRQIGGYEKRAPEILDARTFPEDPAQSLQRERCKKIISAGLEKTWERPERPIVEPTGVCADWQDLPALLPLLLHLPVLCGRVTSDLEQLNCVDGIAMCNNGFHVLAVAHLYTACKDVGLVKGVWPDMDFVIKTQGAENLRLWSSASGGRSLEAAARHDDKKFHLPSRQQVSKLAVRFKPTSAYLGPSHAKMVRDALFRMAGNLIVDPSAKLDDQIRKQWTNSKTLTPVQLLSLLKSSLHAEEMQQACNYQGHLERCATMLSRMNHEHFKDQIIQLRASQGLSEDYLGYGKEEVGTKMKLTMQGDQFDLEPTEPAADEKVILSRLEEATTKSKEEARSSWSSSERRAVWEIAVYRAISHKGGFKPYQEDGSDDGSDGDSSVVETLRCGGRDEELAVVASTDEQKLVGAMKLTRVQDGRVAIRPQNNSSPVGKAHWTPTSSSSASPFRSVLDRCAGIMGHVKETYSKQIAHFRATEELSVDYVGYELASNVLWQASRGSRTSARFLKYRTLLGAFAHAMSDHDGEAGADLLRTARQSVETLRCGSRDEQLGVVASTDNEKEMGAMRLRVQGANFAIESTEPTAEENQSWKRVEGETGKERKPLESLSSGERRAIWEQAVYEAL